MSSMKASFSYVVRYKVDAKCLTPLRTGDIDGTVESVLRDKTGCMIIQGSSIAGAMRDWLGEEKSASLFGNSSASGHLIVSHGLFDKENVKNKEVTRPRLRINSASGAADDGGKFNVAHATTGSEFSFDLTYLGADQAQADQETPHILQMLAALNQGLIRLGAQKSNGFGRVSLSVKARTYDLTQEQDRKDWRDNKFEGHTLELPKLNDTSRVNFTVQAHADRLLVKAASVTQRGGKKDGSATENLTENNLPILPGSSIKGAVLSQARSIAAFLNIPQELVDDAFGRGPKPHKHSETHDDTAKSKNDNGLPCQFWFEDAVINQHKTTTITRIHVDRFTGGVINTGLFTEEPVDGTITLKISAPASQKAACALLLHALRDLGLGLYTLGSGQAIGQGHIDVKQITANQGKKSLTLTFENGARATLEDPDDLGQTWFEALRGVRHEM